jgi:hypothetical protein
MFSRLAFLFILYYLAITLTQPQNRFLFLYPFRIALLAFMLAFVFHLMAVMQEGKPLIRFGPATIISLILLPLGLIAQYYGPFVESTAWNGYIDQLVKSCLAVILLAATATNIYRVWAVQGTVLLSTLWWLKAGVRLGRAGATYGGGDRIMGPNVSMVENPNAFAYFMCVTIAVYLYFYQQYKNKYLKVAFLSCALASVWIVLNTGSRTGAVILVILAIAMFPKYGGQHKLALLLICISFPLILGSVGALNMERFRTIPDSARNFLMGDLTRDLRGLTQDEHSAVERSLKNIDTWRLIKDHPLLGAGMNPRGAMMISRYPFAIGQVHNEMLMAGRQMGMGGMALYLAMLWVMFQRGWRIQKYAEGWWPAMSDLGWTFKIQALVIFVGGQFNPLPWNTYTMALMASASALWLNLQQGMIYPDQAVEDTAGLNMSRGAVPQGELAAARTG